MKKIRIETLKVNFKRWLIRKIFSNGEYRCIKNGLILYSHNESKQVSKSLSEKTRLERIETAIAVKEFKNVFFP